MRSASNHGPASASVFERHRKKTLLLIALAPVIVLDCAFARLLGSRNFADFRRPHPYYHHGLLPNRESLGRWGSGDPYPVYTNSLAMLDEGVRRVDLATSRHRIVILGDSYTEGLGVPYEETFVGLLGRRVDREQVEILNAAVISYCPKLHYLKTRYLLEHVGLEFDQLYVFIDISDIQDEVLYSNFVPREPILVDELKGALQRQLKRRSFTYGSIDALRRREQMRRRMHRYNAEFYPPWLNYFWLDNINEAAYEDPDFIHIRDAWTLSMSLANNPWTQRGVRSAVEQMEKLAGLCKTHGIRLSIAVYPWPPQIQYRDLDSLQARLWRGFANQHHLEFIDLFPHLITDLPYDEFAARYLLPGDFHWNPEGHKLVAEAVWPYLARSLEAADAEGATSAPLGPPVPAAR